MMPDYPEAIHIETTEFCPASCSFCVFSSMNRDPKGRMSEEMFRAVIDEAASWPHPPARILPFMTAEGFSDTRMPDFLRYVNEKLPEAQITFFTLGLFFSEKMLERLEGVRNWADCFISLHHHDAMAYKQETGLDHEKTLAAIERLCRWNEARGVIGKIRLLRVSDGNPDKDTAFRQFCERRFPGYETLVSARWNWLGERESTLKIEHTLDQVCGRLRTLHILADGRQALCCMDARGAHGFGRFPETSLLQLFNDATLARMRHHTKRENGGVCSRCNMLS